VGLDVDGLVKPLANLTYYAAACGPSSGRGWGSIGAAINAGFHDWRTAPGTYDGTHTFASAYAVAIKSCGNWFQLPSHELYLLPVLPTICETYVDYTTSKPNWKTPYLVCAGVVWCRDQQNQEWLGQSNLNDSTPWELDDKHGIVKILSGAPLTISGTAPRWRTRRAWRE